jgi:uncharacterized iron-regulated protein
MTSPALRQLTQLQQALYEKAYQEAHSIVGGSSRAILSYSEKFEKSLPQQFKRATLADLIETMRKTPYVLYGDFHTLRQSQRGLLRILRSYTERLRTTKVVLALEMFKAADQDYLDAYLAGRLSEADFLNSVNYATDWGFPWPNFKMILDFAAARKLPVIGVNSENAGRDDLATRDRFAARLLVNAQVKYPDHKIICLIGEYHLADAHLPKELNQELKRRGKTAQVLRLVNNVDSYYFELQKQPIHSSTEYLKLKKDFFCVMNTPPWMKWQSFSIFEEMRQSGTPLAGGEDGDFDQDFDLYAEETFDVDYQFLHFIKHLSQFLNLKIDDSDMESFHIYFSPNGDFLEDITEREQIDVAEAHRLIERASIDGVNFMSSSNTVLLTYMSINNLAEAAGQYLHRVLTGASDSTDQPSADFYQRMIKAAVGMVASKILNPRRKCSELHHYRQFLKRHKNRQLTGLAQTRRQVAAAILKFDDWFRGLATDAPFTAPPRGIVTLDKKSNYGISRELGQMLGFTLYKKVITGKTPASRLPRLFKKKLKGNDSLWTELQALYNLLL